MLLCVHLLSSSRRRVLHAVNHAHFSSHSPWGGHLVCLQRPLPTHSWSLPKNSAVNIMTCMCSGPVSISSASIPGNEIACYRRDVLGFPGSSACKESACNAGDPGSIPELGRSPGGEIGYPLKYSWASLVAQVVKNLPAMWETWGPSLGWEYLLEGYSSTLQRSCLENPHFSKGLPGGTSGKEPACQCRRCKRSWFSSLVGKIPWRRARTSSPVFLPEESHGQSGLTGYSP